MFSPRKHLFAALLFLSLSSPVFSTPPPSLTEKEWLVICERNRAAQESGVCEVHGTKMDKTAVPIRYGLPAIPNEPSYVYRLLCFPHAAKFEEGGCIVIPGRENQDIYLCKSCVTAESQYLERAKPDKD